MKLCEYCEQNEATETGACQGCEDSFSDNPSGPTLTIQDYEVPKTSKTYEALLSEICRIVKNN